MTTPEQLRKQIEKQKNINMGIKTIRDLSKEKQRLELEYKMLKEEDRPKKSWSKIGQELKGLGNKLIVSANEGRRNLEEKEKKQGSLFKW